MKKLFTFFAALGMALTMQAANIAVSGLQYCDAYYWTYEDEESGSSIALYDFDLYVDYDYDNGSYVYPEVYVQVPANSKTALNGTYEVWYAGYWKSTKDSVESDVYATDAVGSITFKNVDSEGNYQVSLSFTATDGNTYTVNDTIEVWAFDVDNDYADITLNESGSTPAGDMLTCAEAAQIAAANGYKGTTEVTVYGYVTELVNDKVDNNGNQKQSFWMADTENGGKQFEAYYAFVPSKFAVGDRVSVTGILQNFKGTIEIADGQAALLGEGEGGGSEPDEPGTDGALYQIDFKTDITGWTIDDKDLGKLTYVWKQDKSYGMKGSAYNQQAYAAESWLISPAIDLTNAVAPSLVITQALNKGTGANLAVKVSTDNGTSWTDLSINMPAGTSWDFQEDQASLAAFAGKTIQIAFAYKSTTSVCPTWEIGSVLVQDGGAALQQTEQESKATKMLRNGQLFIQRGEKTYTVTGAQIRK